MAFTMSVGELIAADTSGLLGKHPSWERVPLADIASIVNGAPFDSELFSATEGKPLVRIRDVTTGATATYYTGPYEDVYLVQRGDLLIGMDGDFNSGFWASGEALLNQRVCKVSPDESFYDKRLLAYALPGYLSAINANTPSVTVKHLSSKTIGQIELPLPPRAEQARIVAKLEELLSDLDAGVAELKAAQKKLQQYRQSLLKAAVEGALTADWREAQRQQGAPTETGAQLLARILTERRARWEARQLAKFKEQGKTPPKDWQKKYPEPVQPDTTDLPSLPEGWVWATYEQVSGRVTVGHVGPMKDYYISSGIPFLRSQNVRENRFSPAGLLYISKEFHESLSKSKIVPGDIAVVRSGAVGTACAIPDSLVEANCSDLVLVQEPHGVVPEYGAYYLNSAAKADIRRGQSGIALTHFNTKSVASLRIAVPPLPEQREIVRRTEDQLAAIDSKDEEIDFLMRKLVAQRQNILRAAFAGQLVPQDPRDEPAGALLERIRTGRTERASNPKARRTNKYAEA